MKSKLLSGAKLTKALDQVIRDILHAKYPHPTCFVCGRKTDWFNPKTNPRGCQVGHYISRRVYQLRWALYNVWPQCAPCNYMHQFNTLPFTTRIIDVIGLRRINYLNSLYILYKDKSMNTQQKRKLLSDLSRTLKSLLDNTPSV